MNVDLVYYIVLFATIITYLIGLFLSQFEKMERLSLRTVTVEEYPSREEEII